MNFKKKTKPELVELLEAVRQDLIDGMEERTSWRSLPFIPEDLLFEPLEKYDNEVGTIRIYVREGVSCMRLSNGNWVVKNAEKVQMEFTIKSKFHAFQLFRMMGLDIDPGSSSVTGLDKPIAEIIGEKDEEE